MSARIAVTGCGAVSALGLGVPATLAGLRAGRVQPPGGGEPPNRLRQPSPVFHVELPTTAEGHTRTLRLLGIAAAEALAAAGGSSTGERVGVCIGSTVGCTYNDIPAWEAWHGAGVIDPEAARRALAGDPAAWLARRVGATGPRLTVADACASSTDAIGLALGWLRSGRCDRVIAGGADELNRFPYLGFAAMNLSPERCRPFDLHRAGLNLGEGAAVLVLEREADARRRGAGCLGFVRGYGNAADAWHPTAPHPEGRGLRAAVHEALAEAGLGPEEVGHVNAHGTATLENDRVEGAVLAELFDGAVVVSTKGMTGHCLGAAGALEALFALYALREGLAPPCAGLVEPDPACGLRPPTRPTPIRGPWALSDSLGFGGVNAALLLERGDA